MKHLLIACCDCSLEAIPTTFFCWEKRRATASALDEQTVVCLLACGQLARGSVGDVCLLPEMLARVTPILLVVSIADAR